MYFHVGRGLYFGSYKSPRILPWSIGVIILVLTMATAFLGYVLPYGQMSLWGSQIICPTCNNIISFIFESILLINVYNMKDKPIKRILSYKRIGPHNKDIISIFYGCLLGDSHAEYRVNTTRFSIAQEANHKEYLLWLHNIIASYGYCTITQPKIYIRLSKEGKIRKVIRFHTFSYTSIN